MDFNLAVVRDTINYKYFYGLAAVIYFMQTVHTMEPHVLPFIDLSGVVDVVYESAYESIRRYSKCVYRALEDAVANALDKLQKQRPENIEVKLIPLLMHLAQANESSARELMKSLKISSRQLLMADWLTPALEKQLIEHTESCLKSSKQKYSLTYLGRQQLLP